MSRDVAWSYPRSANNSLAAVRSRSRLAAESRRRGGRCLGHCQVLSTRSVKLSVADY
jgi:hypothetical protein